MSEEILKALTQLFAIITKQDGGPTETERQFVLDFFKAKLASDAIEEYSNLYNDFLVEKRKKKKRLDKDGNEKPSKSSGMTSMKDSVRTLAICKKINKTLTQKQKVIVLIQLLELINSDKNFSDQRREIINTVSEVFNVQKEEYDNLETLVLEENEISRFSSPNFVIASKSCPFKEQNRYINSPHIDGHLIFLKIPSVDLYYTRYLGQDELILNSLTTKNYHAYLYSNGSTLKPSKGTPFYYSDVVSKFNKNEKDYNLSFTAEDIEFTFPNGEMGLRGINISETCGKLIGIMGASGAGKTTLLNVLAGMSSPSNGSVKINGINIFKEKDKVKGVIGYISQDDILIEDLSVFENLYFNAKLCFKNAPEKVIKEKVDSTLSNLGLLHIKDLKVGNVLNKKISGGQRKRLNIALELIREPAVMFVDEPTSGLSSRDSENVIDLLKELSLKGKIIFVVIHQPSSDIYKKFDKMFLMDTGGYPIFNGPPVEAITYFKRVSHQINSEQGQCLACGNVNPEQLFDIVEAKVVNEYGQLTNKRKVTPQEWGDFYLKHNDFSKTEEITEQPPNSLNIPNRLTQALIYIQRDLKSKFNNTQYLIINLLEAPLLAGLLSFIIRYKESEVGRYAFSDNQNIPAFILISIIVALFMGLTVSAEEIIKDQKILKREHFLSLSRLSYLLSKLAILFTLSAIQTISYVLISNMVLEIQGLTFNYWIILFSISCFANILGLNISSSFSSAVTVYILIPLLLIPQMILSGALFNFDHLNSLITNKDKTPVVADIMASRWAYEALAVTQYKDNSYEAPLFKMNQIKSSINYRKVYQIPKIKNLIQSDVKSSSNQHIKAVNTALLKIKDNEKDFLQNYKEAKTTDQLDKSYIFSELNRYQKLLTKRFTRVSELIDQKKKEIDQMLSSSSLTINNLKSQHQNDQLKDLVRNVSAKNRIIEYNDKLIQKYDPIYRVAEPNHTLDYRTHLYAPKKHLLNRGYDTFYFNLIVIWIMSLILFVCLYFDVLKILVTKTPNLFKSKS